MDRQNPLNRLDLDDESLLDEQVDAIRAVEPVALKHNGQFELPLDLQSRTSKYIAQTLIIRRLEQPTAEALMNVDRRTNDGTRDLVIVMHAVRSAKRAETLASFNRDSC